MGRHQVRRNDLLRPQHRASSVALGSTSVRSGPGWPSGREPADRANGVLTPIGPPSRDLFLAGEVADDPIPAANSPEAEFSRQSIQSWTTAVESSGAATGVALAQFAPLTRKGRTANRVGTHRNQLLGSRSRLVHHRRCRCFLVFAYRQARAFADLAGVDPVTRFGDSACSRVIFGALRYV